MIDAILTITLFLVKLAFAYVFPAWRVIIDLAFVGIEVIIELLKPILFLW